MSAEGFSVDVRWPTGKSVSLKGRVHYRFD